MCDLNDVYDLIVDISETSLTNAKIDLLKKNESELLKKVLYYTYNGAFIYLLKPFEWTEEEFNRKNKENVVGYKDIFKFLDLLRARQMTGDTAKTSYVLSKKVLLSEKEGKLLDWILERDLHCGIGIKNINKAFPKLIPEFGYMRCSLPKQIKDWSKWESCEHEHYVQEKLDGMFVNINIFDDGRVGIFTRVGTPISTDNITMQEIVNELSWFKYLKGYQLHGEMLVYDKNDKVLPREISNGLLNSLIKMNTDKEILDIGGIIRIYLWDIIPIDHNIKKDEYPYIEIDSPYSDRLSFLRECVEHCDYVKFCKTQMVSSIDDAYKFAHDIIFNGGEGAVYKHRNGVWKNGTSKDQIKLKVEFVVDLEIKEFNEGNGKNKNLFGSIRCETSDGLLEVNVSSSGMTDKLKKEVSDNRDDYIGSVVSVKANNIMYSSTLKPHSLFLPVFVEFREDKTEADTFSQVKRQLESIIVS